MKVQKLVMRRALLIATEDQRVFEVAEKMGADVCMSYTKSVVRDNEPLLLPTRPG